MLLVCEHMLRIDRVFNGSLWTQKTEPGGEHRKYIVQILRRNSGVSSERLQDYLKINEHLPLATSELTPNYQLQKANGAEWILQ